MSLKVPCLAYVTYSFIYKQYDDFMNRVAYANESRKQTMHAVSTCITTDPEPGPSIITARIVLRRDLKEDDEVNEPSKGG